MKKIYLLAIVSIIFLHHAKADNSRDDIRLRLEKSDTLYIDQTTEIETVQKIENRDYLVQMSIAGSTIFEVMDTTDNVYSMDVRYKRLASKIVSPDATIEIDSDSDIPSENHVTSIMHDMLVAIINKSFLVKIDHKGKVLEVSGINELFEYSIDVVTNKYPSVDETTKRQLVNQVIQNFGNESVKSSLERTLNIYPENKVVGGDTWSKKIPVKAIVDATFNVKYKLESSLNNKYQISGQGQFNTNNSDYVSIGKLKIKYDLHGSYSVDMNLNKSSGWINTAVITQKFTGTADYFPNEDMPNGMKAPISITSKTIINDK